jgi:hypothetical protein
MKIIKNLKFDATDEQFAGLMLSGNTVNIGTGSFILHAQLSNQGFIIRRKDQIVFFPMDEMVKTAQSVNENLIPPKPVEVPKPENQ